MAKTTPKKRKKKPGPKSGIKRGPYKKKGQAVITVKRDGMPVLKSAPINVNKVKEQIKKPKETAKQAIIKVWAEKYSQEEAEELYACVERMCKIIGPHCFEFITESITVESGIDPVKLLIEVSGVRSDAYGSREPL